VKEGFFEKLFGSGSSPNRTGSRNWLCGETGNRSHSKTLLARPRIKEVPALVDISLSVADGELWQSSDLADAEDVPLSIVAGLLPFEEARSPLTQANPGSGRGPCRCLSTCQPAAWRTVAGNVRYGMEIQRRSMPWEERTYRLFYETCGPRRIRTSLPIGVVGRMQAANESCRALAADPIVLLMDEPFAHSTHKPGNSCQF